MDQSFGDSFHRERLQAVVLGSARTGLIFPSSREGTGPDGVTRTGQTEPCLRPCAAMLGPGAGKGSRLWSRQGTRR